MNIGIPRYLIVGVAALFSAYHLVLATYTLDQPRHPLPVIIAMVVYAVATVISLVPGGIRMPQWMAALNLAVVVAITMLVSSQLDLDRPGGTGYSTWYVAASGTLLTITSTRRRNLYAWLGILFLAVHTVAWAGPGGIVSLGVVGSTSWVAVSHILSVAMAKAGRDSQRFAIAEREAADWQAAQEARLYERQFRLGRTIDMALPMLRRIRDRGGELTDAEAQECLNLEGAIRDEIRGRRLLNDVVREQVMSARRRGVTVTLLDEGGLDDLDEPGLDQVLGRVAEAVASTAADRVIARTVPEGSDVAVTVVALRSGAESDSALGLHDDDDDDVELWLEIPRPGAIASG